LAAKLFEKHAPQIGMALLSVEEHHNLFTNVGYSNVQIIEERDKVGFAVWPKKRRDGPT
jgi:hypothetical protein